MQERTFNDVITMGKSWISNYRRNGKNQSSHNVTFRLSDGKEIETTVNIKKYYRWIEGLKANATIECREYSPTEVHFFVSNVKVIYEDGTAPIEAIENCINSEKERLKEYTSRGTGKSDGFFNFLMPGALDKTSLNAVIAADVVDTDKGADFYFATVGGYNEAVGYPYFKYSVPYPYNLDMNKIYRLDMKKITQLHLNTENPNMWFYDVSYLNESDFEDRGRLVNLVNQYK